MRRLRYKVLLAIWGVLAVGVLGSWLLVARFLRYQMERDMQNRALALSRALLLGANEALRSGREDDLGAFVEALQAFPDVDELQVRDAKGRVLARWDRTAGALKPDPAAIALAAAGFLPVIRRESAGGRPYKTAYQRVWLDQPEVRTIGMCYLRLNYDRVEGQLRQAAKVFLPAALALAAALSLLGLFFARRLARPLESLRAAALEVGRGRHDRRVPVLTGDELGDTAAAFNQMVEDLSRSTVSRAFFTALVDAAPLAIVALDLEARVTLWNPAAVRLFGWEASETLGRPYPVVSEAQRPDFLRLFAAALGGEEIRELETLRSRKDGGVVTVSISAAPLRGPDGRVEGVVSLFMDLTERMRMESRLVQIEKLSAMGRVAAGVAHEINNPLGVILGFAEGARRRAGLDEFTSFALASIERETLRCRGLVRSLLTFSRPEARDARGRVDLNETAREALAIVGLRARRQRTELSCELEPGLPAASADRNQLQQVLINLCDNALDALEHGGRIAVRTGRERHGEQDWLLLQVRDDGPGMGKDVMGRIFEPFFTTKDAGKGTGLGLALVHEIVAKHGGDVDVESRPGAGSTFSVRLPAS